MKCRSLLLVPAAHPIDRLADRRREWTEDRQLERGADDRPERKRQDICTVGEYGGRREENMRFWKNNRRRKNMSKGSQRRKIGNEGSSVVEMSLVMPVIFGILVLVLWLFLDTVTDGRTQQDGYCTIYTYQKGTIPIPEETGKLEKNNYIYTQDGHVFITEMDVCSSRLRRWQLYGNIICE